jgi:hypothetical protein
MEPFQAARERALQNLRLADHMLHVTYPLLNEPKLLLGVIDHLHACLKEAVTAIVAHERLFKTIPDAESSTNTFRVFTEHIVERYDIDREYVKLIEELQEITTLHRTSPVEFRRRDMFVICTDHYHMKTIHAEQLKHHLKKAKEFMTIMNTITREHEQLFRRR